MRFQNCALLLAGHGSSKNARVGESVRKHAEVLRQKKIFSEVHACFWREKPMFREVLEIVQASKIYIVPMFIGSGYFTSELLPKEFVLEGTLTRRDGKEICYCYPVGVHPNITNVILHRAQAIAEKEKIVPQETCLLLVGHGMSQEENSGVVVHQHAAKIRVMEVYGECQVAFIEQKPFLKDWPLFVGMKNVIVVPFFISNGTHVTEDIPLMLGISGEFNREFKNQNRRMWYTEAIGTDSSLEDVILDQVRYFDAVIK